MANLFINMDQSGLLLFHTTIIIIFFKKAKRFEPMPQDGRHRRIHWAMEAVAKSYWGSRYDSKLRPKETSKYNWQFIYLLVPF